MSSEYNPVVDNEFSALANAHPGPALFVSGYPEHQWEGKYKLKEGDVFVEAGAFWGRYGLIASHRVGSTGRVILIEGNPENCNVIRQVVSVYGLTNVELVEGIVWSKTERTTFCIEGNPAGSRKATSSDRTNYPFSIIEVRAYALDDLLLSMEVDFVDLLACDIEGAEVEMVKGASTYFSRKRIRNVALAAYHVDPTYSEEIVEILKGYGYKDVYYTNKFLPHYGGLVYGHI